MYRRRISVARIVARKAQMRLGGMASPCRSQAFQDTLKTLENTEGLDETERLLVAFKQQDGLSSRRMVDLLRRHLKDVTERN
ncbi:hypothetical protein C8J27_101558 [Rhodobacter aestuarii]|uniref:Uncharacterized protein n=1 Tax=Rhodobacter aestuarii TaxID=453582 RepID=A0A1N7IXB2_9RHOB|nr:hypothetical protein [Rhodobacter aestuarii]PTV97443.1 hypothetical protein C8J27_101558 [Rhodobacter aestuarii]SIS41626.1 hypothetical protein SAMN05421580_10184 [Rhodobacter aestuarii]